jgi:hypothetical protein
MLQRSTPFVCAFCLLAHVSAAQVQPWPVLKPVGMSLRSGSASVGLPATQPSGPPQTITAGAFLSPYGAPTPVGSPSYTPSLPDFYGTPTFGLVTPPTSMSFIPGTVPRTPAPWPALTDLDGMSFIPWRTYNNDFERVPVLPGPNGNPATWYFSVAESQYTQYAPASIYSVSCPPWPVYTPLVGPPALEADADGYVGGSAYFGLGLIEYEDARDDLDALAWRFQGTNAPGFVNAPFYTVDGVTAAAHGYSGATIFWHQAAPIVHNIPAGGGCPAILQSQPADSWVYAHPWHLGLFDKDNVDALIVVENVWTGYQPNLGSNNGSTLPNFTAPVAVPVPLVFPHGIYAITYPPCAFGYPVTYRPDQIFFSISSDSLSVGRPDSNGIPMMPGDILIAPWIPLLDPLASPPTIVIAAEALGLRADRDLSSLNPDNMDDLDALEVKL